MFHLADWAVEPLRTDATGPRVTRTATRYGHCIEVALWGRLFIFDFQRTTDGHDHPPSPPLVSQGGEGNR